MAKKPRSQRRKKGQGLDDDDSSADSGMVTPSDKKIQELLPEDHTIADSASTIISAFEEDLGSEHGGEGATGADDDLLLAHGNRTADQAEAAAAARQARLQEVLVSMDEFASEKRSAKRESRLKRLFKVLSQYATGSAGFEAVASQQDNLRTAFLYSLRQGTPSEQYAACRCMEVMSVILGANQEAWAESVAKHFQRTVEGTNKATAVRMAALRAWAMTVFICDASDGYGTEQLMDFCEVAAQENFRNETTPLALRATALDAWALLATTVEDVYLAGQDDVQIGRGLAILSWLSKCLDIKSVEIRAAAGECLSLIHEARLSLGINTDEGENATEKRYSQGSWEGTTWEVTIDEVKQRIAELAVESGRSLNKKARKQQRATFRDFANTIVEDEAPEEVVSFRNGAHLTLGTWREIIQLNFVRHCLQGGFQMQLSTNATLQAIFGADKRMFHADNNGGLSQVEKRLLLSKGSEAAKEAHMELTRRRDKRENIKNHFLTVDGEGI
ncbi:hypothetical protein ACA910_018208 [Epithemia clementina (nom. ined.)]